MSENGTVTSVTEDYVHIWLGGFGQSLENDDHPMNRYIFCVRINFKEEIVGGKLERTCDSKIVECLNSDDIDALYKEGALGGAHITGRISVIQEILNKRPISLHQRVRLAMSGKGALMALRDSRSIETKESETGGIEPVKGDSN